MSLKTFVKVGNITNLSDARYCAGMGVDLLGFCFDKKSEQYIDPESYQEIIAWVSGPKFVGEFASSDEITILGIKEKLKLDYIQVNDPDLANRLSEGNNIIYAMKLDPIYHPNSIRNQINALSDNIKYILIYSDNDVDSGLQQEVEKLATVYSILKGYNLNAQTVATDVSTKGFTGISLKGSQELQPGIKDYDELADILEALEDDD